MSTSAARPAGRAWVPLVLLLWGAFSPTALHGELSTAPVIASMLVLLGLTGYLVWTRGANGRLTLCAALLVIAVPLALSWNVEGERIAWGKAMFFLMLAASYLPKIREVRITRVTRAAFNVVSFVLLAVAGAIVLRVSAVAPILVGYYNTYYDLLMPNMLAAGKPVGTFASHNVAALFYYFFFYMHLRSYAVYPRLLNLALALAFLATILLLKSNTSLAFSAIGFVDVLYTLSRMKGHLSKVYAVGILALALACAAAFGDSALENLRRILNSTDNGLTGRFASGGNMRGNLEYLLERPFSPVGFQYRSDLFYGDCGYIEMLLRGSLPLLLAAYLGLVAFMRQNVLSRQDFRVLLAATLIMEIGFSNLISVRFLFLFPFAIIYLNGLERAARAKENRT